MAKGESIDRSSSGIIHVFFAVMPAGVKMVWSAFITLTMTIWIMILLIESSIFLSIVVVMKQYKQGEKE